MRNKREYLLQYKEEPKNLIPYTIPGRTIYTSPEHMQWAIDTYFQSLQPTDKRPNFKPPTVPGLAYAIGLKSKSELQSYARKSEEFETVVGRALLFIESFKNDMVLQGNTGAIMDLKQHHGWTDKVETTTVESPLKDLMDVIEGSVLRPKLQREDIL